MPPEIVLSFELFTISISPLDSEFAFWKMMVGVPVMDKVVVEDILKLAVPVLLPIVVRVKVPSEIFTVPPVLSSLPATLTDPPFKLNTLPVLLAIQFPSLVPIDAVPEKIVKDPLLSMPPTVSVKLPPLIVSPAVSEIVSAPE